jgi:PAS domain S-box-containing protein
LDKINLLLVEHIEEEALQVADHLGEISALNIDIHFCQNLGESYELLRKERIDIILLNLFLPDGYGLQSYTSLFSELPDIPYIVLTELDDSAIAAEAVKNGAQDYIPKEKMNSETLFRSITYAIERKQFERELRRSEERYRQLFSRSKDAIYISTPSGEFVDFNPAGLELFGYNKEELTTLKVKELYINQTDRDEFRQVLEEHGQISDYEIILKKKDGKTHVHCLLNSMIIYNEDNSVKCYQGIIRDISERKKAEQALFRSLADLDLANKELHQLNETLEHKVEARTEALKKGKRACRNKQQRNQREHSICKTHSGFNFTSYSKIRRRIP